MAYETIRVDSDDGVAVLTLNRPEKKNAMNPRLHDEVTDALETLRYDDDARVLVITGAGDAFSAGMDLKEFFIELKDKPAEYDRVTRVSIEWRGRTIRYFPKPTIAMVNGHCYGGAFTIVEACDLAVAADEAKFALSEINFKMFPGGSVSKSMGNLLRPRDYLWYAMTGRPVRRQDRRRYRLRQLLGAARRVEGDGDGGRPRHRREGSVRPARDQGSLPALARHGLGHRDELRLGDGGAAHAAPGRRLPQGRNRRFPGQEVPSGARAVTKKSNHDRAPRRRSA